MEGKEGVPGGGGGRGMLGLEMSLHHDHTTTTMHPRPPPHLLPFPSSSHPPPPPTFGDHAEASRFSQPAALGTPSPSPWHRMKWTDSMVRLLIMIVYCVGDDGSAEQQAGDHQGSAKGKKAAAGMLQQKKGKWKSVSLGMMEKGFYVSPQQCEDKFNDLNKRYKRVNELLGKGTACRVVENHALLDTLDHVSPKAKDEARKLLNSKHLFFQEMCAYHHTPSLGSSAGAAPCASQPPPLPLSHPHHHHHSHMPQQPCFNHPSDSSSISAIHVHPSFLGHGGHSRDNILGGLHEEDEKKRQHHPHHQDNNTDDDVTGDNDDDDEVEGEDEEEEEEDYEDDNDEEDDNTEKGKRGSSSKLLLPASRTSLSASPPLSLTMSSSSPPPVPTEQLMVDLMGSLASVGGEQQQRQWLKRKAAELEEQRVVYQCRALKLERQRFKWLRFSSNKEREMEKMRVSNERLCLENDRMLLLLRQKEQQLLTPP